MQLELLEDGLPGLHHLAVLRRVALRQRGREHVAGEKADELVFLASAAAQDQRPVDRDVAPLPILEKEHHVGDEIEDGFQVGGGDSHIVQITAFSTTVRRKTIWPPGRTVRAS